ncbi:MAG: hypothetical protein UH734_07820 [Ruminococcus sp.]|nr:hypothetical protein [Ruminococcus sp.]
MICLNHLKRLVAIILIVAVTAITAGCSAGIRDAAEHSTTNAVSAAESTESIQPTETDNTAAKASYTMADIKNLKNTEHFAKNTLEHIFDGTINGKGKATGYHYTQVTDSKGKAIDGTRSDVDDNGVFFHEISCLFTVKPNERLLQIKDGTRTDGGPGGEYLEWIDLDKSDNITLYPDFYRTMDFENDRAVKHFLSRE